jgi:predicted nucleotidyltransferase
MSTNKTLKVKEMRAGYDLDGLRGKHAAYPPNRVIEKCKQTLAEHYGKRLGGVILYGSRARGQASPASDIDLLVLLSPPFDYFVELRQLVDVLYPVQLEAEQLISAKPVSVQDFELGSVSLYRNAKREGIAL